MTKQEEVVLDLPDDITSIPKIKLWEKLSTKQGSQPVSTMNTWDLSEINLELTDLPWDSRLDLKQELKKCDHIEWIRPLRGSSATRKYKLGVERGKYEETREHIQDIYEKFSISKRVTTQTNTEKITVVLDPPEIIKMNQRSDD